MNDSGLRRRLIALGLLLALLLMGPQGKCGSDENLGERVLLEIGQEKITVSDFLLYLRQINPRMDFAKLPASEQRHWLDEFVNKKLFALRARETRLDQVPEVRARLEFFADTVLAQEFKDKLMREATVTEEELTTYYRSHPQDFEVPARVLLQHFLYKTSEKVSQARARLQQGTEYTELAKDKKTDSDFVLAERAWFTKALLIPELADIAFQLSVGGVSNVVHSSYGYHVLRVEAQEPTRIKDFEAARSEVLEKVRQTKATRLYEQVLSDTRNSHQIRLHLDQLNSAAQTR